MVLSRLVLLLPTLSSSSSFPTTLILCSHPFSALVSLLKVICTCWRIIQNWHLLLWLSHYYGNKESGWVEFLEPLHFLKLSLLAMRTLVSILSRLFIRHAKLHAQSSLSLVQKLVMAIFCSALHYSMLLLLASLSDSVKIIVIFRSILNSDPFSAWHSHPPAA